MSNSLTQEVEQKIKSGPVVIFMKGTPAFPNCGFSARSCQVLRAAGATDLVGIDILNDPPTKEALKAITHWPTFPQIFIKGEFIGGCDIVCDLYERGELQTLLSK